MARTSDENRSRSRFGGITPILNVRNLSESVNYYVNVLGFKKDWDWGDPPTFASVSRDDVGIFLCEGAQGQSGMWMSIFVENVDQLYEEYRTKGARIRQVPTNFSWGMREMNIEDPDGHRLRISSETSEPPDSIPLCEE